MGISKEIDFLGKRYIAFVLSGVLILVGIVSIFTKGLQMSIDFKSGILMHLAFKKDVAVDFLRKIIATKYTGIKPSQLVIQKVHKGFSKEKHEVVITLPELSEKKRKEIVEILRKKAGLKPVKQQVIDGKEEVIDEGVLRVEHVGPAIGKQLRKQALMAIFVSLIGMLIYITYRFQFKFAVGAIVALAHDCLIVIGIFALLQKEISISIIAALLTIIGYSLNDTIVICDRIRENIRLFRTMDFTALVNKSLNQSLSRTINTSLTTFIPVLILFLLGGAVLKDFAFAMLIGVVAGTYSSIYIVSPIVVAWRKFELSGK